MHGPNLAGRLRSLLHSAPNGILLDKLDTEYHLLHGGHIFLGKHKDLESLLRTLPDVCYIHTTSSGQKRVSSVPEVPIPVTPVLNRSSTLTTHKKLNSQSLIHFQSSPPPKPATLQNTGNGQSQLVKSFAKPEDLDTSGTHSNGPACTRHSNGGAVTNVATNARFPSDTNKPVRESLRLSGGMVAFANPWDTLLQHSATAGLPEPNVRFLSGRESKHAAPYYLCTLTFNGKLYKSYPELSPTEAQARDLAAAKVLVDLKIDSQVQCPRNPAAQPELPRQEMETPEQIENVIVKLLNMFEGKLSGMRCDAASKSFAENFGAQLPGNWTSKIKGDTRLHVVKKGEEEILYKMRVPIKICSEMPQIVPELAFPAEGQTIFITCVINATHFRALVDKERRKRMETKLHAFYSHENIARSLRLNDDEIPTVGTYYAALAHKWYRVRCVGRENKSGPAKFHFIDCGAIQTIPKEKIHHLSKDFYSYPSFSIDFCLEGSSAISGAVTNDQAFINETKNALLLKEVWVCPQTGSDTSSRPLPVTVYTCRKGQEGSELIKIPVMGHQLPSQCSLSTPVVSLPPGSFEAYLTHVSEDGTFFLQIEGSGLRLLNDQQIEPSRKTPVQKVSFDEKYCAQLKKCWARCVVTRILSLAEIGIEFIDYGIEETVSIDKIYPLKLTKTLEDLPPQAVRTHLTNILPYGTWRKGDIADIIQYCPQDEKLIVEKSTATHCRKRFCDRNIQHVYIYKRNPLGNQLIPVNAELHRRLR